MEYKLTWMEHWSEMRDADDPRVIVRWTEELDGWYEHEYAWYFIADGDDEARGMVADFIAASSDLFEIWSLMNKTTGKIVATEEDI